MQQREAVEVQEELMGPLAVLFIQEAAMVEQSVELLITQGLVAAEAVASLIKIIIL
jgi:hypothetical protein